MDDQRQTGRAKGCLWFRLDVDLESHPKVFALAEAMGCSDEEALARIVRFWTGVRVHAPSGDLTGIPAATIAGWMRMPTRSAEKCVTALSRVGFVFENIVYGWNERQGAVIARAERDAKRWQEHRNARRAEIKARFGTPVPPCVPPCVPSPVVPHDGTGAIGNGSSTDELQHQAASTAAVGSHPIQPAPEQKLGRSTKKRPVRYGPPDPRRNFVWTEYEAAYLKRYGTKPAVTSFPRVMEQIGAALRAVDGDDRTQALVGLIPAYFDLADRDKFYEGAPIEKLLMGTTLSKLRASAKTSSFSDWFDNVTKVRGAVA